MSPYMYSAGKWYHHSKANYPLLGVILSNMCSLGKRLEEQMPK